MVVPLLQGILSVLHKMFHHKILQSVEVVRVFFLFFRNSPLLWNLVGGLTALLLNHTPNFIDVSIFNPTIPWVLPFVKSFDTIYCLIKSLFEIQRFSFKKIHLKMLSAKGVHLSVCHIMSLMLSGWLVLLGWSAIYCYYWYWCCMLGNNRKHETIIHIQTGILFCLYMYDIIHNSF